MSKRAHYSASTLSDAAGGRKLPTLAVTLAYVRACGGDAADWEERWHATAVLNEPQEPEEDGVENPYPGSEPFGAQRADCFFGREKITEKLVNQLSERRIVAIFGASGSGKSSLLEAGLIGSIRRSGTARKWTVLRLTPGSRPLRETAVGLAAITGESAVRLHRELVTDAAGLHLRVRQLLAGRGAEAELLLVVDQFEEVFTECRSTDERRMFVAALLHASQASDSRTRLVLGVRSDFARRCDQSPALAAALDAGARIQCGPMTAEQLRSAIVRPATTSGRQVEGALVATIIAEATGQPGALPLISQALRRTWQRTRGTTLTLAAYQASGGMTRALVDTAEEVFSAFDEVRQRQARDIFVRLTALGSGDHDTRRCIPDGELDAAAEPVVTRLTEARLVTADSEGLEFAHDALIRAWPRLRTWLSTGRDDLCLHRRLTEAAGLWDHSHHDPAMLYRGSQLDEAIALAGRSPLTLRESAFLEASTRARDEEVVRANRSTSRFRRLVAAVVIVGGMAAVSAALAVLGRRQDRGICAATAC